MAANASSPGMFLLLVPPFPLLPTHPLQPVHSSLYLSVYLSPPTSNTFLRVVMKADSVWKFES